VKPILGLFVLLAWPCLGWGSRAEASFALGKSALAPEGSPGEPGFELRLVLNGMEAGEPERTSSSSSLGKETTPFGPGDPPRTPETPRDFLPVPGGSLTHGATSTGAPSAGASAATGLPFILPLGSLLLGGGPPRRLFLADERLNPQPIASRLFRPPRAV